MVVSVLDNRKGREIEKGRAQLSSRPPPNHHSLPLSTPPIFISSTMSAPGWKRAPKPDNIKEYNKHPYNSALANGPASSQSAPSSKLAPSRGLMARGLNPVLGFMVIGTLAWCSFQMLTESRVGKEKERGIASVQNPMGESVV